MDKIIAVLIIVTILVTGCSLTPRWDFCKKNGWMAYSDILYNDVRGDFFCYNYTDSTITTSEIYTRDVLDNNEAKKNDCTVTNHYSIIVVGELTDPKPLPISTTITDYDIS